MKGKLLAFTAVLIVIFICRLPFAAETKKAFHSPEDISFFKVHIMTPIDSGEYFLIPQNCKGCHGFDTLGLSNIDGNGIDINLYDDWETSMMGLAGVDPMWKAKVSHEILVNPSHSNELQTFCTSCHAPMGHYSAMFKGQQYYTLADLATDSLGKSGVSCHSCHAIKDSSTLGTEFSGVIPYDTNRHVYGPFTLPLQGPMQLYVGLTPMYSPHVSEGRMCSPCHTLISNSVDLNGIPTGTSFVEQATYHEWLNSDYPAQAITCQTCHMPQLEDGIQIANGYTALPYRVPFNLHEFAGANSFMVNLIKNNKQSLGVDAPDANFDSTLSAINRIITKQSVDVTMSLDTIHSDSAFFSVQLKNKAGHKFPTGYPSRRAVLQFVVLKPNGDTLFASGIFDPNFEVINTPASFESHHDVITDSTQTQIYEMVMGDVNGNRTSVLERGFSHLKDNRIPPLGFTTIHNSYDTMEIAGNANIDPDFNKLGLAEGTGIDIVHYHIGLGNYIGPLSVHTNLWYQTIAPAFLNEMSTYSSSEIDTFMNMYANANKNPILVGSDSLPQVLIPVGVKEISPLWQIKVSPNPSHDGVLTLQSGKIKISSIQVFDRAGRATSALIKEETGFWKIILPELAGIYYLVIRNGEDRIVQKVLKL
ncbi:hypothetical protein BH11BAC2_BH11BAC2_07970 [soil metagenome]